MQYANAIHSQLLGFQHNNFKNGTLPITLQYCAPKTTQWEIGKTKNKSKFSKLEKEREKKAENYQVLLTMASTLQSEASKFYMMECHNIYKEMNEKISKGN